MIRISSFQFAIFKWLFAACIIIFVFIVFTNKVFAATNISSTDKWAWNDAVGWINFYSTSSVNVKDDKIEGYAELEDYPGSYVSLDCATGPPGSSCGTEYHVSNDGNGSLAGWAWNDTYGWISFCGNASGGSTWSGTTWVCPASPTYQVTIDPWAPDAGDFLSWAWNDVIGWISFNCSTLDPPDCTPAYKVNTTWRNAPTVSGSLISSTFDTGFTDGVGFDSIMWRGSLGTGQNVVKFQLATSNCSNGATNPPTCSTGSWAYWGPTGDDTSYYETTGPGAPVPVVTAHHNNKRYYRYKVYLDFVEEPPGATRPVVEDIIVNWSP